MKTYSDMDDHDETFPVDEWPVGRQYLACMYWAFTSLTTVGYGDIVPGSDRERAVAITALVVGTGFYSYIIGSVSTIIGSTDKSQRMSAEKMDQIYSFMKHRRFPMDLRRKVARYFKRLYEIKSAMLDPNFVDVVLGELDPNLRHEVALFMCSEAVSGNWLLSSIPKGSLLKLSAVLRPVMIESGEDIITAGDQGNAMFILKKGSVAVLADNDSETVIRTLTAGTSFGEAAALGISYRRTATVRSLEPCELVVLNHDDLCSSFPEDIFADLKGRVIQYLSLQIVEMEGEEDRSSLGVRVLQDLSQRSETGNDSATGMLNSFRSATKRRLHVLQAESDGSSPPGGAAGEKSPDKEPAPRKKSLPMITRAGKSSRKMSTSSNSTRSKQSNASQKDSIAGEGSDDKGGTELSWGDLSHISRANVSLSRVSASGRKLSVITDTEDASVASTQGIKQRLDTMERRIESVSSDLATVLGRLDANTLVLEQVSSQLAKLVPV